jgi:hypothetical protein
MVQYLAAWEAIISICHSLDQVSLSIIYEYDNPSGFITRRLLTGMASLQPGTSQMGAAVKKLKGINFISGKQSWL